MAFDPYHKWLGIPPEQQPASHYRLLGIAEFESDADVIDTAAAFLNLSRTKIWELVQQEQLPAFKLGGDYRYRRSEVVQWLERYRVNQ